MVIYSFIANRTFAVYTILFHMEITFTVYILAESSSIIWQGGGREKMLPSFLYMCTLRYIETLISMSSSPILHKKFGFAKDPAQFTHLLQFTHSPNKRTRLCTYLPVLDHSCSLFTLEPFLHSRFSRFSSSLRFSNRIANGFCLASFAIPKANTEIQFLIWSNRDLPFSLQARTSFYSPSKKVNSERNRHFGIAVNFD